MAQSYTDPVGGELFIPAAYPSITVAPANGGLATSGVLVLLGEAESGPSFSEETDLGDNSFGADDVQAIVSKYKSGPLVDAAKAAVGAAVDPDITVPFNRAIPVKTNIGTKASSALTGDITAVPYDSLVAKSAGALGNLIFYTIKEAVATVAPTTGSFTAIPACAATNFNVVVDGGAAQPLVIPINAAPDAIQAGFNGLTGVAATGGVVRAAAVTGTVGITVVSGNVATFTAGTSWNGVAVGDTISLPAGALDGANGHNEGWWVVTNVSGLVVTATKLADTSTTLDHVAGTIQTPETVAPAAVTYGVDIAVYTPVVITHDAAAKYGVGKSLEIASADITGDTDATRMFYVPGTTTKVAWLSLAAAPYALVSSAERKITLNAIRKNDNVDEDFTVGGEIGLKLGYAGYSCDVTINSTGLSIVYQLTNVSAPVTLSVPFASYQTIADAAAYIGSISGFYAAPGTNVLGNLPSSALDYSVWGSVNTTFSAVSVFGIGTCRIKIDAYRFRSSVATAYLVALAGTPQGGLPALVANDTFLVGGAKGGTTAARIVEAVDALEQLRCNFVVPCFSQDASLDKVAGLTDAASTYEIDAINSVIKTHVHKMSGMKTKRNRQAFVSKRGAFNDISEASANLASHRCMMTFQDIKASFSGSVAQYQPYISSALAASMQAGAFYKSIVRKQVNVSGAIQTAGDWSYNLDSNIEDALKAGLNPIRKAEEGGFIWVSDQTTYGKDNKNFYNSVQMVYAGDIVALTTAQRMERAFVGQSIADVSAPVAVSYLDSIMADFLRLKLIAPSDDAPLGYKNAKVKIDGSVMRVSVEVKIAGSIYFTSIAFYVTEITQTA